MQRTASSHRTTLKYNIVHVQFEVVLANVSKTVLPAWGCAWSSVFTVNQFFTICRFNFLVVKFRPGSLIPAKSKQHKIKIDQIIAKTPTFEVFSDKTEAWDVTRQALKNRAGRRSSVMTELSKRTPKLPWCAGKNAWCLLEYVAQHLQYDEHVPILQCNAGHGGAPTKTNGWRRRRYPLPPLWQSSAVPLPLIVPE